MEHSKPLSADNMGQCGFLAVMRRLVIRRKYSMRLTIFRTLGVVLGCALCLAKVSWAQVGPSVPVLAGERPTSPYEWLAGPMENAPQPLPHVELTGELLYQILAADFAAQRGAWAAAISTSLEVARRTRDPRMAQRALEFALAADNLGRGWEAARLWRELAPTDPGAEQAEVMLAAANGHPEGLTQVLAQQLAFTPDQGEAILQIQIILSRLGDPKGAQRVLNDLLVGHLRDLPEAHAALAQAAYEAGDPQLALTEARAALAARPDWDIAAGMVLQFGMPLQPEATLSEIRRFIARKPEARSIRLSYVSALMRGGRTDEALSELSRMMRQSPEDFELLYLRGAINAQAGRTVEARRWLDEYIAIEADRRRANADYYDPTSSLADAEMLRIQLLEEAGQLEEALQLLNQVKAPEALVQAGLRKAIIRARQGRMDAAMAELDAIAIEDEREGLLVALTRAQLLRTGGQLDAAVRALEQALPQYPDSSELRYELALLYERQNRLDDVEYQLRQVIEADSRNAHAHNALGYTLAERNIRLDEARALIERAMELRPGDPAILDSMGWVLYRQGDLQGALRYLEQAWTRLPQAEIGAHLGEVLWQSGQRDTAREVWRKAHALDPEDEVLKSTLQRFQLAPGSL